MVWQWREHTAVVCLWHCVELSVFSLQQGANRICDEQPLPSVDDLADQVAEVLDYFGLLEVIGLGVTAGDNVLTHLVVRVSPFPLIMLRTRFLFLAWSVTFWRALALHYACSFHPLSLSSEELPFWSLRFHPSLHCGVWLKAARNLLPVKFSFIDFELPPFAGSAACWIPLKSGFGWEWPFFNF